MLQKLSSIIAAAVLGLALVIATLLGSQAVMKAKASADNVITMTGSAKEAVVSDAVKWSGSWSRNVTVDAVKDGYGQMAADEAKVRAFLKSAGIDEPSVKIGPVIMNQVYKNSDYGPREYTLSQSVEASSADLGKVETMAKRVPELVNQGVLFASNNPQYTYSGLAAERVKLLSAAVADARNRADEIVKGTGLTVGAIRSASMGVVQVLAPNSTDISDYGSYDTDSKDKEVMVTVRVVFGVGR